MFLPGPSLACLTPATCLTPVAGLAGGVAGGVTNAAAGAVLGAVGVSMSNAADWLVGHVLDLMQTTGQPHLAGGWFRTEAGLMEKVVAAVVLPVLMAASVGPVLRQDLRRLGRVWGVGLPVAILAGLAASQLAGLALAGTDQVCLLFLGRNTRYLASQFSASMASGLVSKSPVFVRMFLDAVTVVGAVLVWLEMMLRSAAVYVAVFFMPLVLVGYVWPSTAGMAKRGVEILLSLILSKFVIVATLSLGLAALGGRDANSAISGAGLMLLAGFAPFTLMRLAPVVEAAAIGHLEGMSRRPARAAARAAGTAASAPAHPAAQLLMSGLSGRPGSHGTAASPVAPQILASRPADFPLSESPDGTPGPAGPPGGAGPAGGRRATDG